MDYRLELIVMPATDMGRAKAFYSERVGFRSTLIIVAAGTSASFS